MIELDRDQFKKQFGCPPGKLFDLTKCIENRRVLEMEAMRLPNPKLARVRSQYGTMKRPGLVDLIYCLDIAYWIEYGMFKASIQKVVIFDDLAEQCIHKAEAAANQPKYHDN